MSNKILILGLYVSLFAPVLLPQSYEGWPLAGVQLCVLASVVIVVVQMARGLAPPYRRGPLDLPILGFVALALVQLLVSNRILVRWALSPPSPEGIPPALPTPAWTLGTVYPRQTLESLVLLLTYAGLYVVVVVVIRRRRQLESLVRALILCGSVLAFAGLIDALGGSQWLEWWNEGERGRVTATFINPDHFANWLVMIMCLGGGYLAARRRAPGRRSWAELLWMPKAREDAIRRYLPAIGLVVMAVALIFTLSRGALLGLALALVALLAGLARLGRVRWTLAAIAALGIATLCYAGWIGLTPLVERVTGDTYRGRGIQWMSTLPMVRDFPLLGVGLGAYRDIYPRYQPLALSPDTYFYPYAHNDVLQLIVETGALGGLLLVWAVWRALRFLHGHLLRPDHRTDPFSVGIAIGAATGLLAFCVHSLFDFSARIPANGLTAATLLGIVHVSLQTRFLKHRRDDAPVPAEPPRRPGAWLPITGSAVVAALIGVVVLRATVGDALVERSRASAGRALRTLDIALKIDSNNVQALLRRARLLHARATSSESPRSPAASSQPVEDLRQAASDGRRALALRPTDSGTHETLGLTLQGLAERDPANAPLHRAQAIAHLRRAVSLAPDYSYHYARLARVAAAPPQPAIGIALAAARAAIERDPTWVRSLGPWLLPMQPSAAQWSALAPRRLADQLELADWLETQNRLAEAEVVYREAVDLAEGNEKPLALWMLARLRLRRSDATGAKHAVAAALTASPANPELHLTRGDASALQNQAAALDDYRQAATLAAAQAESNPRRLPFDVDDRRLRALIAARRDGATGLEPLRYQIALGRYLNDRRLWAQALDIWGPITAQRPEDAAAHFFKAAALDGLGRRGEALNAYQQAVSRDAGNPAYRMRLASHLWEAEQYYQAIAEWRAVVAAEPKNVEALLALAKAYDKVGDRVEAFRQYRAIVDVNPADVEARRALVRFGAL